jgi:ribosome maturation factor RimP
MKPHPRTERPTRRATLPDDTPASMQMPAAPRMGWREAIESTVAGLHFELVDVERAPRGLLRITIDRRPGQVYASGESEFVLVGDCEQVTRQLQYVLEVEGLDYARLEVSSPGLDRPLRVESDFERFVGHEVNLTLKLPLQGRKNFRGVLQGSAGAWALHMSAKPATGKAKAAAKLKPQGQAEQELCFNLSELKEARLVPVVDFKGRGTSPVEAGQPVAHGDQVR